MKTEEIMVATEKLRKTGVSTEQANKNLTNYSKGLNMNKDIQDLTIKEVCSCIALLNKLQQERIMSFDLETTTATFNTDNTTKYLKKQNIELQERINKVIELLENFDVFKEFSFPLMKRDEENQIKTSIKYEFDTTIKEPSLKILKGDEENDNK